MQYFVKAKIHSFFFPKVYIGKMVVVIQLVKGQIGKKVVDPRDKKVVLIQLVKKVVLIQLVKKVVLIQLVKGSIGPTGEKFVLV